MKMADARCTTPTPGTHRKSNYDDLPEAFRPPRNRQTGLRDGGEPLFKLLPVSTLPRGLMPKLGYHYHPPRFYFGWPCTDARFEDLRKKHPNIVTLIPNRDDMIDIPIVIGNIKRYTIERLEITSFVPHFSPIYGPAPLCLAVADSYFVGCVRPPYPDVRKLQRWLGIKEDPMWYLDGTTCCAYWGYSHVARNGERYVLDEPSRHYKSSQRTVDSTVTGTLAGNGGESSQKVAHQLVWRKNSKKSLQFIMLFSCHA
ncbi:hypothetical protein Hypma_004436 [Hypsizygus marmoreus]|uniref:Uncharacterized protein n=1 Tax=Hypsizygus marmoreus TaxID=39966 RepID=A0A369JXY4_HYPMA|nr:hypothetical protein Hypma_004436 [Hypsizygus marmoreus]